MTLTLYSFGDFDRSSKIRWLAAELGLEVVEERVGFPAHQHPGYLDLHPFGQVPTVVVDGQVLTESTATLEWLAETVADGRLAVLPGAPERSDYLRWRSLFAETFEGRLVDIAISRNGLLPASVGDFQSRMVKRRLQTLAGLLPQEGWLCGERFTVADIVAGYSLRLAVDNALLEREQLPYLDRLVARPAARESRMFSVLQ